MALIPKSLILAAFMLLFVPGGPARAAVFHSRAEVAHLAFPDADHVELRTFTLDDARAAAVEKLARAHLPSRTISAWIGRRSGRTLGYAFVDSSVVRTLPATFLIVISPSGRVSKVETLAFYERDEYLPMRRWLRQFEHKPLSPSLSLDRDIVGIAGATLTSRTVTSAVRRALALCRLLFKDSK